MIGESPATESSRNRSHVHRLWKTIPLACASVVNLLAAFIAQWWIFRELGAGEMTDALAVALLMPQLLLGILLSPLGAVLVPIFAAADESDARRDAWTSLVTLALAGTAVWLVLAATQSWWLGVLVPGLSDDAFAIAFSMSHVVLPTLPILAVGGVITFYGQGRGKFVRLEVFGAVSWIVTIGFLLGMLPKLGVIAAAWAILLRSLLFVVLLAPLLGRIRLGSPRGGRIVAAPRRLMPLLLAGSYYKSGVLFDRFLSSMAPSGQMALLMLAQQMWEPAVALVGKIIGSPARTELARAHAAADHRRFDDVLGDGLKIMAGITVAGYLALLLVGRPVLHVVFVSDSFTPQAAVQLWWLLVGLGGVWFAGVMGQLLAGAFYARGETAAPAWIGATGFTLGLAMKVGAFYWFGVIGIALGSSAYYVINALALGAWLLARRRRQGSANP